MRKAKNRPFPNLVPRVFSVFKDPGNEVEPFPYSLKLTNIYAKESFWLVYTSPKELTALEGRTIRSRGGRR